MTRPLRLCSVCGLLTTNANAICASCGPVVRQQQRQATWAAKRARGRAPKTPNPKAPGQRGNPAGNHPERGQSRP